MIFERRGHSVQATYDGEECVKMYRAAFENKKSSLPRAPTIIPFDAVILDCKMPKMDGLQVAIEILKLSPRQRIIFISAYVKKTLEDSIKQLDPVVELVQKPFHTKALIDTIEDVEIYGELEKLNVDVERLREMNPTHLQITEVLEGLRKLMKGRTF